VTQDVSATNKASYSERASPYAENGRSGAFGPGGPFMSAMGLLNHNMIFVTLGAMGFVLLVLVFSLQPLNKTAGQWMGFAKAPAPFAYLQ
jgi:hypothetical protein